MAPREDSRSSSSGNSGVVILVEEWAALIGNRLDFDLS